MERKSAVLHILPHCGGGVGAVLRSLLEAEYREDVPFHHSVASLEYINDLTRSHLNELGILWTDCIGEKGGFEKLSLLVKKADIVLIHWWNHPLLMRLLYQGLPPSRLAVWSHVNGFSAPQSFFPELFELPDRFVFATKASFEASVVQKLPDTLNHKLCVIRSCAGIPADAVRIYNKEEPFRFGYVGTVEPTKMHPSFLEICAEAKIPTKCIVAGGPTHNELRSKAELLGIGSQFDIVGPVDHPENIYRKLHVFAYPLNPSHYGTGEQVLIEAMAYGAVPVVFANHPEKSLIEHGKTGIVVNTLEEFSKAIRFLADNHNERKKLAAGARQFIFDECDINIGVHHFHALYEEMLRFPKCQRRLRPPSFGGIPVGSPFHLFLTSCGSDAVREMFQEILIKSDMDSLPVEFVSATRGTPHHYLRFLGHDSNLEYICKKLRESL